MRRHQEHSIRAAMTILGKLRGQPTDQEKVPLPMNLNDEALMHHGSLIAVSFAWHRICGMCPYFCAIVLCPCPSLAPCPPPCPSSCGPRATSLVMGGWLVLIPIRNPFRITASAAAARHRFFPDQAPHSLVSLWPVLPLNPLPACNPCSTPSDVCPFTFLGFPRQGLARSLPEVSAKGFPVAGGDWP